MFQESKVRTIGEFERPAIFYVCGVVRRGIVMRFVMLRSAREEVCHGDTMEFVVLIFVACLFNICMDCNCEFS